MPIESIIQPTNANNLLYRPIPTNQLQQNLAHFYERTSSFVQDQLNEMFDQRTNESSSNPPRHHQPAAEDGRSKLNPRGMGTLIDIYV